MTNTYRFAMERFTPEDTVEGVIGDESGNALVDLNKSVRYRNERVDNNSPSPGRRLRFERRLIARYN